MTDKHLNTIFYKQLFMDKNQLIIKVQLFLPRSNNKVDNIEIE